jgi:LmeA-like phospholipid-binding
MATDFFEGTPPARRKRHPIRAIIVTLIVLAALLVPGYFVAESLAEAAAKNYVQAGVAKELSVASTDDVHVNLGKGSIILQAIQGRVKKLTVGIDRFSTDTVTGSARFTATGVPLSTSKAVDTMGIVIDVDPTSLTSMVAAASGSPKATVILVGQDIRIGTSVTVLGKKLPVSVDLIPTVAKGQLVFTPHAITLNKSHFTVKSLLASPIGSLVKGLVTPRVECVASSLPRDLALTNVAVTGDHLVLTLAGSDVTLDNLSTKGSCAAK